MPLNTNGQQNKKSTSSCAKVLLILFLFFIISTVVTMFLAMKQVGQGTFYVKITTANIRECPAANCAVVDTFPLNSEIVAPYRILGDAPEWVEINFSNDQNQNITGYISKSMLSEKKVSN